ncbi:hypothetical protein MPER_13123 [Moniliophthora perniciosa FA553]|nr:hypothetical protein MPER_13123 [Moniliophthora perniciosa FA553]
MEIDAYGSHHDVSSGDEDVQMGSLHPQEEEEEEEEGDIESLSERHRRKGKERARNVERFLDLEAEVSQDEDDEDEDGDMDDFIDNSHDFEGWWIDAAYESLAKQTIAEKNQDHQRHQDIC